MSNEMDLTVEPEKKGRAAPAAAAGGDEDLSQEIARSVARNEHEQVTCRRVTRNFYRCNWWSPQDTKAYDNPAMTGSLVTTSRISSSQFLHATKVGGQLKIRIDTQR